MLAEVINEQQVLKCLTLAPDKVYQFEKPFFQSEEGTAIFNSIKSLYEQNIELTKTNILNEASRKSKKIDESTVDIVFNVEASLESFDFYFSLLKKSYAKEKISNKLLKETLVETSYKDDRFQPEIIRDLINEIEDNLRIVEGNTSHLMTLTDMFTEYTEALRKRSKGEYKFEFGDSHLDKQLTVGAAPGQITTLFGATGMIKSTYTTNVVNKRINKQIPSVYISLEMDTISTLDRIICQRKKIPIDMLYPKVLEDEVTSIPEETFKIVEEEKNKLSKIKNFFFVEESNLSLSDVESIIQEASKKFRTDYFVIFIDLLTMLRDFSGKDAAGYEDAMNRQSSIAKRNNVHFFNVVQANRNADSSRIASIENIPNLRPNINTIKNSHAIAERSRIILGAFRPKYYAERLFPEETDQLAVMDDTVEIQLLKQSQGRVGQIVKYLFDGPKFSLTPFLEVVEE